MCVKSIRLFVLQDILQQTRIDFVLKSTNLLTELYSRLEVAELLPLGLFDLNPVQHSRKLEPVLRIVDAFR